MPSIRRLMLHALLPVGLVAGLAEPAVAFDYNGSPVGSLLLSHNRVQIESQIAAGWRPTSIELESTVGSLGIYRVNYVQNVGSHAQQVKFLGEVASSTIDSWRNAGWRVEDIEVVGSKLSAILVGNLTVPRTTLHFWGWTASGIESWLSTNPSYRLLDLDRYPSGGSERYAGVFLRNTGSAAVGGWGWSPRMSWSEIGSWASANGMRVIDLDRRPDGYYTVVFAQRLAGQRYYYFGNRSMDSVLAFLGGYGLRVQNIAETTVDGTKRYSGVAVNNVGAQAARLADRYGDQHNGVQGYYLEQVGSGRIVDLNAERSMHPSSTIKILLHFTAINDTSTASLNTRLLGGFPLPTVLSLMMWNSDNAMANRVLDAYGPSFLELIGQALCGMSPTTQIRNRFGTGGPYGNDSVTTTTLVDLGRIYRTIQGGYFNATKDSFLRANMLNETRSAPWNAVMQSVRGEIGISTTNYNDYVSRVRSILKAGSNSSDGVQGYWSIAGVVRLPVKGSAGGTSVIRGRDYLFGHYVNASSVDYDDGWNATAELLREQIKETMSTFK